jgi:hypothetical protein
MLSSTTSYEHVREALLNHRVRVFLTVASLFFAALLVFEIGRTMLHAIDRRDPAVDRHRVVDRPAEPAPATGLPRASGRSLIRHAAHRSLDSAS